MRGACRHSSSSGSITVVFGLDYRRLAGCQVRLPRKLPASDNEIGVGACGGQTPGPRVALITVPDKRLPV
jgi:hypothetical protein